MSYWPARPRPEDDYLTFHVCPRNQGQTVEIAYAADGEREMVIRRRYDRSDLTTEYQIAPAAADDEGDYWQSEPENDDWRALTAREMRRYGLE